jgi:pyruvate/2-oxoacid:ferredoxin oxidoreductase alpha subunit/Pyruvate/2-oxoacid:ferredoxin oxidoreductase delta subunit
MPSLTDYAASKLRALFGVKPAISPAPYPGTPATLTGREGLQRVDGALADHILSGDHGLQLAVGEALAGRRVTVLTSAKALAAQAEVVRVAVEQHLPMLVIAESRNPKHGNDDEALHALAASGAFVAVARDPQHALDLALVARRVAERALMPAILVVDTVGVALTAAEVLLPETAALQAYLGHADDQVAAGLPGQALVLGEKHRRVPIVFDPDLPTAIGAAHCGLDGAVAAASRQVFFADPVAAVAREAMEEWSRLTGRSVAAATAHQLDTATAVVLALGPEVAVAEAVATELLAQGVKAGVVGLTVLRPVDADLLRAALGNAHAVTVLEHAHPGLALTAPLQALVREALAATSVKVVAAVHGDVGQPVTAAQITSLYRNMQTDEAMRPRVHLGLDTPSLPSTHPRREVLRQAILRGHPHLDGATLPGAAAPTSGPSTPGSHGAVPATVRRFTRDPGNAASLPRFWGEVLQPRLEGDGSRTYDPWLALGRTPAASAACLDHTGERSQVPQFDATACTACGRCWTSCPDAAIGPLLLSTEALLNAAADRAHAGADRTVAADKLRRAHKQLAGRLDGQLAKDKGRTLTPEAARDGLQWLTEKLGVDDAERTDMARAFERTLAEVTRLPIAVAPVAFHDSHAAAKGSGLLLLLGVDPHACQGCGVCSAVCAEGAITAVPQTPEVVATLAMSWQAFETTPDTAGSAIAQMMAVEGSDPLAAVLLSRHCHGLVPGADGAEPGSGSRLGARLVTAVVEYQRQRELLGVVDALGKQATQLRDALRATVADAANVTDLDAMDQALSGHAGRSTHLPTVLAKANELGARTALDGQKALRLTRAARDVEGLKAALLEGSLGTGRARFGVVVAGASVAEWAGQFPCNPFAAPMVLDLEGHGVDVAMGLAQGLLARTVAEAHVTRLAALALQNPSDLPAREEALLDLKLHDLTNAERALCPPVLVLADGPSARGVALGTWTQLLSSGLPVKVVVLDQGIPDASFDPAPLAALPGKALVAATSLAHPAHLFATVGAASRHPGAAVVHVYAPSPRRQEFPAESLVERARLAVATREFPLFQFDPAAPGAFGKRLSLQGNPTEVEAGLQVAAAPADRWAMLQEWAGEVTPFVGDIRAQVEAELTAAHAAELAVLEAAHAQERSARDADAAHRLRERLLQLANGRAS